MITERSNYGKLTLLPIAIILIASIIAGCVGSKGPQTQLDITAKAASSLILEHKGGDALVLTDVKITVKKEVDGKFVDGLNSVLLSDFQDIPGMDTLVAGKKITHTWKEPLSLGDVLLITLEDVPSGKLIFNQKVSVR
ncbi:MAG: type IV pilin [Candidatus Methanoperedens sp.]|nr:type IV pilin [Candidatus Methanoperedens sp.]MCE8426870.1 type IV pilin [Candidatus Methanoperedens sp.]